MKTVAVSRVDSKLDALLGSAQKERVILTRAGKPCAVLIGVESYDEEDLQLAASEDFWRLIESRRQGPSIPLAELKVRLRAAANSAKPRKAGTGSAAKRRSTTSKKQ